MKQTVINVLRNSHTQKVNFIYTAVGGAKWKIYANDFVTVALNIEQGNITVEEGGADAGTAKYTIRDDGNSKADTLYIGSNNNPPNVFHSLFVHESVHAIYDVKGIVMPWLDNEAIAYIAQGFYLLHAGRDGDLAEQAFYGYQVAQYYHTDERCDRESTLRQSLLNDPLYKKYIKKNFVGDGIEPPQNQPKAEKNERIHIVKPGDWLSKIAVTYYGDAMKYKVIHQANLQVIGPNPDIIKPGQRLVIP
ncbi:hypothetical protein BH10ACI1_BH10ACI1_08460 [soil metagenome]